MADQPKKKPLANKTLNDARRNKKASKQDPNSVFGFRKQWRGHHTKGVALTEVQKVNLGGGLLRNTGPAHPHLLTPWRGMDGPSTPPFDREQAKENERLYPHLFTGR